jgi:lipoate-protein ligase A
MTYLKPPQRCCASPGTPEFDSTDAKFNFALEKYAMDELDVAKEYFMFWRTTPTLMTGRYQNTLREINMPFAKENGIDIVRRVTGGGTIYTDENGWQFSFIVKEPGQRRIEFDVFMQPVLDALNSIGVKAEKSGRNDLVIEGRKFSGNAQYLRKNVVLHHGSLLFDTNLENLVRALNVDDEKIISKGIQSVRQRVANIAEFLPEPMTSLEFRDLMLKFLLRDMDTYELTPRDIVRVNEIRQAQFGAWEWNFGKDPAFNITKEARFAGGKLSVQSFVDGGIITDIRFYGDFFAHEDLERLQQRLIGCAYREDAIRTVLHAEAEDLIFGITPDEMLSCII